MSGLSIELSMLMWSTILFIVHIAIAALGADATLGLGWAVGNRETQIEPPAWVARARRAQANMAENLLPFALLILVAHLSGSAGYWSALGAQLFLGARIVYLVLYLFGVKVVRTIAYFVAVAGILMVIAQLF